MFGYVRVNKPELKVKEYEMYRGTYCGLCRAMGKCTGQCSRMTLSYDFAFLALIRVTLLGDDIAFASGRCIAHPFTKRSYMKRNPSLDYCAGAAALLNYHKIKDDLADERGLRWLRAAAILPFVAYSRRRAVRKLGLSELDERISAGLASLSEIEGAKPQSVDEPARAFGEILGDIIAYGIDGDGHRVAHTLGVSVGKWIYIADALEDWREDARKGRYNPFILLYGKESPSREELDGISVALKNELFSAEGALDLIDFENSDVKRIIENILYLGLPKKIEEIADDSEKKRKDTAERNKD